MSYFETKTKTEFAALILAIVASFGMLLPSPSFADDELDVFKPIEDLPEVEIDFGQSQQSSVTKENKSSTPATAPAPTVGTQAPARVQAPAASAPAPAPASAVTQAPPPPVPARVINAPNQPLREFAQQPALATKSENYETKKAEETKTPQVDVVVTWQQPPPPQQAKQPEKPKQPESSAPAVSSTDPFAPIELPPIVIESNRSTANDGDVFEPVNVPSPEKQTEKKKSAKKVKVASPSVPEDEMKLPSIKTEKPKQKQAKKNSKLAPPVAEDDPINHEMMEEPAQAVVPSKLLKKDQTTAKSEEEPSAASESKPAVSSRKEKVVQSSQSKSANEAQKPKAETGIGKTLAEFAEGKLSKPTNVTASSVKEPAKEKETPAAKCENIPDKPSALTSQAEEIIKALEQESCRGCSKLAMLKEKLRKLKLSNDPASKLEAQVILEEAANVLREMQRESSGKLTRLQVREAVAFMRVAEEKDLHRPFIEKAQDSLVASKDLVLEEIRRRPEVEKQESQKPTQQAAPAQAPSRLEQFAEPRLIDQLSI